MARDLAALVYQARPDSPRVAARVSEFAFWDRASISPFVDNNRPGYQMFQDRSHCGGGPLHQAVVRVISSVWSPMRPLNNIVRRLGIVTLFSGRRPVQSRSSGP